MATEAELKAALIKAHNAGDTQAAQLFASKIKQMRAQPLPQAQTVGADGMPQLSINENPSGNINTPKPQETNLLQDIVGGGEAALSALTGLVAGAPAMALGNIEGVVGDLTGRLTPEQAQKVGQQYAQSVTYAPRTIAGQRQVAAIGETLGALPPVLGAATPLQAMGAGQAASQAARMAPAAAKEAAQTVAQAAQKAMPKQSQAGTLSVGAAQVPEEIVTIQKFQDLPVKVPVTMADVATGDERFKWKQFENEMAKDAEQGQKYRDIAAQKNSAVRQNLDEFIDMTGSSVPEGQYQYLTGEKVREALKSGKAAGKERVTAAYNKAREAGELEQPIPQERLDTVSTFVNDSRAERSNAPVLKSFVDEAVNVRQLGAGSIEDGTFRLGQITLDQAETLRQRVNKLVDKTNPADLAAASQIKNLIDQSMEGLGGNYFKAARNVAKQEFDKYENNVIIKSILDRKGNSNDPKIAAEQIVQKAVFGGSVDDLDNFRRVLMKSGANGVEAWKDVQAAVLRTIRDEALRGKSTVDTAGLVKAQAGTINKMVDNLDKNGKLNKLFGKKGADQLRLLREVSGHIAEQMPGTLNASNTASAMVMFLRNVPVVGKITTALESVAPLVRDAKLRSKINKSINVEKTLKEKGIDVKKYGLEPLN